MTDVTVVFLEVGQGDCTLAVDHTTHEAIMIDCPRGKAHRALDELVSQRAERLELVVATHSDLDHLGGIYPIVDKFPTATIRLNEATVVPADPDERKQLKAALRAISGMRHRHVNIDDARRGDLGAVGDIRWRVFAPTKAQLLHAQGIGSPNHASVVLRLEVGDHRFLIPGDADAASWRKTIDAGDDISALVFLFPHHGAELLASPHEAGADEVLDAVSPKVVVLSFGATNGNGHPHPTTLNLFAERDQTFLATQLTTPAGPFPVTPLQAGTVRFHIDSEQVKLAA
jgi:beta-lactamase superfamily II metal-dependent hydrolase